jgi:stage II sporulation protein M
VVEPGVLGSIKPLFFLPFLLLENMSFKGYIFSLRRFILVAFLVFISAIILGYFSAQSSPDEAEMALEQVRETLEPVIEMPPFGQFLIIFLNNSIIAFLAVILGLIFGIFPFLVLFSNGLMLGIIFYFTQVRNDWSTIFALILPHGIFEILAVILACAVGLKLGRVILERIFKKEVSIKTELNIALSFFLRFLFPLLAIAAAIEVFLIRQFL